MSTINESGINLAENRTFRAFILLYTLMSVLILALMGNIYYQLQKEVMLSDHRLAMQLESDIYIPRLKRWMQGDDSTFPIDLAYRTALFDEHGLVIHSTLKNSHISWNRPIALNQGTIHFVVSLASYELGDQFLVFEADDDRLWLMQTWLSMGIFGSLLLIFLLMLGWSLAKLFLRPMKEAIMLLDDFIKDTTHELNTPLSAILSNIEMLDLKAMEEKTAKKINRIAIAARTISTIYDDLTYLVLNHDIAVENRPINMTDFVHERLEYFQTRYRQKQLHVELKLDRNIIVTMDRTKAMRLIDNLLSNAIKYNQIGGEIKIRLTEREFSISDTGIGIPSDKLQHIFERYQRADTSVGGFGIGLHIVAMIVKEYGMKIEVDSREGEGTAIVVQWT